MRNTPISIASFTIVLAASVVTVPASSQPSGSSKGSGSASSKDKDRARELAKSGVAAAQEGRHEEALVMLAEAEALFHAPTHLLFIARSQAALGRLREARTTYQRLADENLGSGSPAPFREAQATGVTELEVLVASVPKIDVDVDPSNAKGLRVTMNGAPLSSTQIDGPFEVDPGRYSFEATADGFGPAARQLDVPRGRTTKVTLVLETPGTVAPPPTPGDPGLGGAQIASIVGMAVGIAGLGVGGTFGVLSLTTRSDADEKELEAQQEARTCGTAAPSCNAGTVAELQELDDRATLFGNVGIAALVAGGVILGAGITVFLVSDSDDEPEVGVVVSPGFLGVRSTF